LQRFDGFDFDESNLTVHAAGFAERALLMVISVAGQSQARYRINFGYRFQIGSLLRPNVKRF